MVYNKIDRLTPQPTLLEGEGEMEDNSTPLFQGEGSGVRLSALKKIGIDDLRDLLYQEVSRIHAIRYPYNNFLY